MSENLKLIVQLDLKARSKNEAIEELVNVLSEAGKIDDPDLFRQDLQKREEIMSTYCGYHLAIPHSESYAVREAAIAFARVEDLVWDEGDDHVRFIIMLAIPKRGEGEENEHVDIMSSVAMLALEDDVRDVWENAKSGEEIIETFMKT